MRLPVNWAAIDPGANTGIALLCGQSLVALHTVRAPAKGTWSNKTFSVVQQALAHCRTVECVAIEVPAYHGNTVGGTVVARSGSLVKLSMLVGALICTLHDWGVPCIPYTPTQWKGQLPKAISRQRTENEMRRLLWELRPSNEHEWDAVGIALHALAAMRKTQWASLT